MTHSQLIDGAAAALSAIPGVLGVFLAGSMGRQEHDEFSDIDLLIVADPESLRAVAAGWDAAVGEVTATIFADRLDGETSVVFTYITPAWVRLDVKLEVSAAFSHRAKSLVVPLHDPRHLYTSLPDHGELVVASAMTASSLVREFYRVLALLPVALGRGDYAVGASGSALLRSILIQAFTELTSVEDRGGVLHLKRLLAAEDYEVVAGIPPIAATRESLLAVQHYCARQFTPVAHVLCDRTGVAFPDEFVNRVHEHTRDLVGDWLVD